VQAPSFGGPTRDSSNYTPWFTRVLAYVIDSIPIYLLGAIGGVVLVAMQRIETVCVTDDSEFNLGEYCATGKNGPSTAAWIIFSLCILIAIVFQLWNRGYRQGNTGSSIGKQIVKFKVVGEQTQQPIGGGKGVGRELIYLLTACFCGILWLVAVLFPLWDARRQTLFDKLMKTVCVPL
jgi:uncharacterized RDD family membrane protein YckC